MNGSPDAQSSYAEQYNAQSFGTQQVGPFQQNMDITVQGKLLNAFTVNGRFTNQRYGNYLNQTFGFNYKDKGTTLDIGDVSASLPGNEFVSFSRTVRGLDFSRDFGNGMRFQGIGSYTNAVARRGTFQGNGTRGPYPLASSSIIEGSEHVELNGQPLVSGQDYQIDYLFGQITFLSGRIINPADTIVYTYEAQDVSSSPGLLTGFRYDLAQKNSPYAVGVTWEQQTSLEQNKKPGPITERFPVSSSLTYQYAMASAIQPGTTVTVQYLDQVLVQGVDYELNTALRYLQLLKSFPPDTSLNATLSLSITYTPVAQTAVNGDRSVMGLDGTYRLNPTTSLNWEYGRSQNTATTTTDPSSGSSGDALALSATFGGGKHSTGGWNGTFSWRDVGSTFAGIDSTSSAFLQAQKGVQGTLNYRPTSYLGLTSSMSQSQVGTNSTITNADGTTSNVFQWSNSTQYAGSISLSLPKWPRIDLSHTQTTQEVPGASSTSSHFDSDQLNVNYQVGMLGLTGSFSQTDSVGQSVFATGYTNSLTNTTTTTGSVVNQIINGTTATSSATDSASDTARLTASLTPASWISMTGAIGLSHTKFGAGSTTGTSGTSADANDNSFGIRLPVRQNLSFGFDYSNSSNGENGTQNTTGTDANGNPISGTQVGSGISSQRTQTTNYDVHYQPFEKLDLSAGIGKTLSIIPGYDNTTSNNIQFTASYAPYQFLTLFGTYSSQDVGYLVNQSGGSNDKTYQASMTLGPLREATGAIRRIIRPLIGPFGKMTFTGSAQYVNTGSALSTTTYSGNGSDLIGTSSTTTSTTTYSSQLQNLTLWSLRGDYPVGGGKSLFGQWQSLDSQAPAASNTTTTAGTGYTSTNYVRGTGSMGFDMRFSSFLGFSVSWNVITMHDRNQPTLSYTAQTLQSSLSAQF